MKKLVLFLAAAGMVSTASAQLARVQAIHNSADAAAATVDVYLTTPLGSQLLIDDFAFRTASPYIDAPAGVNITLGIAPGNSTSVNDTIPGASFTYNLTPNETYVIIADGIVSPTGYSPAQPFNLEVYGMGREMATTMGNTDVLVHHGSTDAPTVDVDEVTAGNLVDNASYTDYAGYLQLPTADYQLQLKDASGTTVLATYDAPLATLGLQDSALVVVASGFLNPAANSNGADFGLWVALPGGGAMIQLPATTARVQAIHNSADAAASTVDVYLTTPLGSSLLIDDFAFRTASPFIDAPAGLNITLGVAPSNSTSVNDTIPGASFTYNLASGETYVLVADGIVSPTGYSPAQPFGLSVYGMGREAATMMGNTDVLVHHGSTDAPTVDVDEVTAGNLVDDISYTEFDGYLQLPTADYTLEIKDASGTTTVAAFDAPLATLNLQNAALVVVASGFLNPANNSNGPAFGLWVALPAGGAMVQLPAAVTSIEEFNQLDLNIYPNPAIDFIKVEGLDNNDVDVQVFGMDGKLMISEKYAVNANGIDISGLSEGMYQIVLTSKSTFLGGARFMKQ